MGVTVQIIASACVVVAAAAANVQNPSGPTSLATLDPVPVTNFSIGGKLSTANLTKGVPLVLPVLNVTANDCRDLSPSKLSPACFIVLNTTSYLKAYNGSYYASVCSSGSWSTCYLKYVYSNVSDAESQFDSLPQCNSVSDAFPNDASSYSGFNRYNNTNSFLNESGVNDTAARSCYLPDSQVHAWNATAYYGVVAIHSINVHIGRWINAASSLAAIPAVESVLAESSKNTTNTPSRVLQSFIYRYGKDAAMDTALIRALEFPYNYTRILSTQSSLAYPKSTINVTTSGSKSNATVVALPFGGNVSQNINSSYWDPAASVADGASKNASQPTPEAALALSTGNWGPALVSRLRLLLDLLMTDPYVFQCVVQDGAFGSTDISNSSARILNMISLNNGSDGSQYSSNSASRNKRALRLPRRLL